MVNPENKLFELCEEVPPMPKTLKSDTLIGQRVTSIGLPLVVHYLGNGYSRDLCHSSEAKEVLASDCRLFHQMGEGRATIKHHIPSDLKVLGIKHRMTSVDHPQTNEQVEAANKVILGELKKRLNGAKGRWAEELAEVLWAYGWTPQSTN